MVITPQDIKIKPGSKRTEVGVIPEVWEVKNVGEIGNKIFNGGTPSTQKSEYWSGNIPWITGADIVNQRIDVIRRYITKEAVNNSSTNIIEKGNLLLVTRTGVGKMAIAPFDVAISQDITGIYVNDKINVEYLFLFFDFNSSKLKELNQGTSIAGITRETLITTLVAYPPRKSEQTAIASVLSDTDALITSLDRLIAKKRDIKQATMQQLLTGKTRLPGFSGEWKMKKLGEIFQFLNTANNARSDLSENGEIKYIHYGDIHTKWRSFLDCSGDELPLIPKDKVRNVPFLEDGDLVMADASEDYEGIGISIEVKNATGKKVVAGLHTFLLRGDKEVLADGFKSYLQYIPAVKDALRKAATGISVYGISKNNVRNISICLPDITEQRAISTILSDMDAEIAALEQKRDKTRALKQGMMQELLTGKTRLV